MIMNKKVVFRKIKNEEFNKYKDRSIKDYANNLITSGTCDENSAYEQAKKEFNGLLVQGMDTPNHFINIAVNEEKEDVGFMWYLKESDNSAFICDFFILDEFRRSGYGKQTMLSLETEAKTRGIDKIKLHVFEFNKNAILLYENLGYVIYERVAPESIYMSKDI